MIVSKASSPDKKGSPPPLRFISPESCQKEGAHLTLPSYDQQQERASSSYRSLSHARPFYKPASLSHHRPKSDVNTLAFELGTHGSSALAHECAVESVLLSVEGLCELGDTAHVAATFISLSKTVSEGH